MSSRSSPSGLYDYQPHSDNSWPPAGCKCEQGRGARYDRPASSASRSVLLASEGHSQGMLCSIFLVEKDGMHLRYAAAPNLPQSYRIATDGATIGPNGGPCSLAACRRQAVFVADFLSDSNCLNFRNKPLNAGLLAGWSSPIIAHDGQVLGTFGMYFREVRKPTEREVRLIDYASRVAGIAIERSAPG